MNSRVADLPQDCAQAPQACARLTRDCSGDGLVFWHLSNPRGETSWEFLDYMIYCIDSAGLNRKTVENKAYSLAKWLRYLWSMRVGIFSARDSHIKGFRDLEVERIPTNSNGSKMSRKRSINQDVRAIYQFYGWLQNTPKYGQGRNLLGSRLCQITSTLDDTSQDRMSRSRHRTGRYPLAFRDAAEGSKHRLGFVPDDNRRAQLVGHFYATSTPDVARRNTLMFSLAWHLGWRRGSILSLTVDDFEIHRGTSNDAIQIVPRSQKFSYGKSFSVPTRIVAEVLDYVDGERRRLVARTGAKSRAIFLSLRTGEPLSNQAASSIFSKARSALGWPHGSGLHCWRRGFANNYLEREVDARLEIGLDTSGETLALSLAYALGQENISSQTAYIRDTQRRALRSTAFKRHDDIAALTEENMKLVAEVAELRSKLKKDQS